MSSDDDDHKKSISDVIFSAKKASPRLETVVEPTKLDLDGSPTPDNDHPEMSTSSPIVTTSHDEDSSSDTTNSYSENNVNQMILETPYDQPAKNESQMCPTLAVQEDISDYVAMTPQCEQQANKTDASSAPRRSNHVRNPSLLSGNTAQTIQFITGGTASQFPEPGGRNLDGFEDKRVKKSTSKRPLYVYVDYSYEKESARNRAAIQKYDSPPRKHINDLLTNTCTSHLGNAIDTFVPGVSSNSMSILNGGSSTTSSQIKSLKSKSNGNVMMSGSSSTTTRTSSMVSSSNDEAPEEPTVAPPPTKYRQANVAKLVNKRPIDSNGTKTMPTPRLSSSVLESAADTFVKSNFIRHRVKDLEAKHETSV